MSNRPRCAIYVSSWDGYSDLWEPFFKLFWKCWPDCPYPVYLGANSRDFGDPRVTTLKAGWHDNWTDRTREHLAQIPIPFVIMMLEDWFLIESVETLRIEKLLNLMEMLDGHMIRLVPDARPTAAIAGHPEIGLLGIGVLNRTNTHATIWRKSTLQELMRTGESLWQFEVNGSARSNRYSGGFFSVWTSAMHYVGAVDGGKWTRSAARRFGRMDIGCNFAVRKIRTRTESARALLLKCASLMTQKVLPLRARQQLKLRLLGSNAYLPRK